MHYSWGRRTEWIYLSKFIPTDRIDILADRKWIPSPAECCRVQISINIWMLVVYCINIFKRIHITPILHILGNFTSIINSRRSIPIVQWTQITTPLFIIIPNPINIIKSCQSLCDLNVQTAKGQFRFNDRSVNIDSWFNWKIFIVPIYMRITWLWSTYVQVYDPYCQEAYTISQAFSLFSFALTQRNHRLLVL